MRPFTGFTRLPALDIVPWNKWFRHFSGASPHLPPLSSADAGPLKRILHVDCPRRRKGPRHRKSLAAELSIFSIMEKFINIMRCSTFISQLNFPFLPFQPINAPHVWLSAYILLFTVFMLGVSADSCSWGFSTPYYGSETTSLLRDVRARLTSLSDICLPFCDDFGSPVLW